MKLTTLSLIAITTVFTFAGVQPMAGCKDTLINKWDTYSAEQKAKTEERLAQKRLEEQQTLAKAEERLEEQNRITEQRAIEENRLEQERIEQTIVMAERLAFNLINNERVITGLSPTIWDDSLYQLSKEHTREMANQKQLFHSDINAPIGENAWGGFGYSRKSGEELAQAIVNSWMSSPLHKAWILNTTFQHSVVSIVSDTNGQYASWTFWRSEVGDAPPLIRKASALYQAETGGSIPWLTWLHDIKGYPNNPDFLRELGIK